MIDSSVPLQEINRRSMLYLGQTLGMEFIEIRPDALIARMEVTNKNRQPLGYLNGGASAALAEITGSTAGYLSLDRTRFYCLGLSISCNHIRGIAEGWVYATAREVHVGSRTQVWQIENRDKAGNLLTFATHTLAVLEMDESMKLKYLDLFYPQDREKIVRDLGIK